MYYKFCKVELNQGMSITYKNIVENEFALMPANTLNDPFEFGISFEFSDGVRKTAKEKDFYRDPNHDFSKFVLRSGKLSEKVYMTSFTKKFDDILMWSHYGDRHRGICFEYDEEVIESWAKDKGLLFKPVIYTDDPISICAELSESFPRELVTNKDDVAEYYDSANNRMYFNFFSQETCSFLFNAQIQQDLMFTKKTLWQSENEFRLGIISDSCDQDRILINCPKPTSIYLGIKIDGITKHTIYCYANMAGILVEEMEPCFNDMTVHKREKVLTSYRTINNYKGKII